MWRLHDPCATFLKIGARHCMWCRSTALHHGLADTLPRDRQHVFATSAIIVCSARPLHADFRLATCLRLMRRSTLSLHRWMAARLPVRMWNSWSTMDARGTQAGLRLPPSRDTITQAPRGQRSPDLPSVVILQLHIGHAARKVSRRRRPRVTEWQRKGYESASSTRICQSVTSLRAYEFVHATLAGC